MPRRPNRTPATGRVLKFIISEIDAGNLAPGSRINAANIATNLDLSVAPVREAICVLAGRGVVDLLPDRGAVMRPLSSDDVIQIWEAVAPVAALGVRLAAMRAQEGRNVQPIIDAYEQISDEIDQVTPYRFLRRLNDWHQAANQIGGNPYVQHALESLGLDYWARYVFEFISVQENVGGYLENYRRMHEAVLAGDPEGASGILHYHANWSIDLIRKHSAENRSSKRPKARTRTKPNMSAP